MLFYRIQAITEIVSPTFQIENMVIEKKYMNHYATLQMLLPAMFATSWPDWKELNIGKENSNQYMGVQSIYEH